MLKAYILVNNGALLAAEKSISFGLMHMRQELPENHLYIFEAHYVYSIVYLYSNKLKQALQCALKAQDILYMGNIKKELEPYLWELIGEIYLGLDNYPLAKNYMLKAYDRNRTKNFFSDEVTKWMKEVIESIQ